MGYWLLKSEPSAYGLADLAAAPLQTTPWEGVRNYQARNFLRDDMRQGDQAFFYHSNTPRPAIMGIVEVVRAAYPDETAFDPTSQYYDPTSSREQPRWYRVDVRLVRELSRPITLAELRQHTGTLSDFALLRRGSRLSVMPVTLAQWQFVLELEAKPAL